MLTLPRAPPVASFPTSTAPLFGLGILPFGSPLTQSPFLTESVIIATITSLELEDKGSSVAVTNSKTVLSLKHPYSHENKTESYNLPFCSIFFLFN